MARMVTSTGAPEFWAGAGEPNQPHASTASARMDECRYLIAAPQCPTGLHARDALPDDDDAGAPQGCEANSSCRVFGDPFAADMGRGLVSASTRAAPSWTASRSGVWT